MAKIECEIFRNERFISREKKLSDTIKKIALRKFQGKFALPLKAAKENLSCCKRKMGLAHKPFEIILSCDISTNYFLCYDLTEDTLLFDSVYLRKPEKSSL